MLNIYQSSKLYNLIALGKAGRMDVTSEVSSVFDFGCSPGLTFLLPFLLFVQVTIFIVQLEFKVPKSFQLYNAYTLLQLGFAQLGSVEWQVFACGFLFGALGIGNLSTTLSTYKQKYSRQQKQA
jgi:hypothetical protein